MRLNQNMFSLNIYSKYKSAIVDGNKSMSKISSGLKINSAKDNPNKITQNELLKIQILAGERAKKNIQDTNSMIQTFDGAMQEMNNSLLRMKELTVQAGSGTLTDDDRATIQIELDQLKEDINSIANNTEFNKVKLINGSAKQDITAIIGTIPGETLDIPSMDLRTSNLGDVSTGNTIDNISVLDPKKAQDAIACVDLAIKQVSSARSEYGAIQLRLDGSDEDIDAKILSLQKAQSELGDADIAEEMINLSKNQILMQSSISLMSQSNNLPLDALNILKNLR